MKHHPQCNETLSHSLYYCAWEIWRAPLIRLAFVSKKHLQRKYAKENVIYHGTKNTKELINSRNKETKPLNTLHVLKWMILKMILSSCVHLKDLGISNPLCKRILKSFFTHVFHSLIFPRVHMLLFRRKMKMKTCYKRSLHKCSL